MKSLDATVNDPIPTIATPTLEKYWPYVRQVIGLLRAGPNAAYIEDVAENDWVFFALKPQQIMSAIKLVSDEFYNQDCRDLFYSYLKPRLFLTGCRIAPNLIDLLEKDKILVERLRDGQAQNLMLSGFFRASDVNYLARFYQFHLLVRYVELLKQKKNREMFYLALPALFRELECHLSQNNLMRLSTVEGLIRIFSDVEVKKYRKDSLTVASFLKSKTLQNFSSSFDGETLSKYLHLLARLKLLDDIDLISDFSIESHNAVSEVDALHLATTLGYWNYKSNTAVIQDVSERVLAMKRLRPNPTSIFAMSGLSLNNPISEDVRTFVENNLHIVVKAEAAKNISAISKLTVLLGACYQILSSGKPIPISISKILRDAFFDWKRDSYSPQHAMLYGLLQDLELVDTYLEKDKLPKLSSISPLPSTWIGDFLRFYEIGKNELLAN